MTTLRQIQLTCPVCSSTFSSQTVLSAGTVGGTETDFHERVVGPQPLAYLIHTCSSCGYTGDEHGFGDGADFSAALRDRLRTTLEPTPRTGPLSGSDKYELAARIAVWQGSDVRRVAELLLRAAWCCVDEGDVEAERYFRRHAAWAFEGALGSYDEVDRGERALLTYLVGELWRRVGDTRKAREWFDRVAAETTDSPAEQWVLDLARQQRDQPREWFR
jgi:uncharacterized protein (DUF2225 family)